MKSQGEVTEEERRPQGARDCDQPRRMTGGPPPDQVERPFQDKPDRHRQRRQSRGRRRRSAAADCAGRWLSHASNAAAVSARPSDS